MRVPRWDWRVELLLHSGQLKPASVDYMYIERKERWLMIHLQRLFDFVPKRRKQRTLRITWLRYQRDPGQRQVICLAPFCHICHRFLLSPRGQLIQHLISRSHNHFTCLDIVQNMHVGGNFRGCEGSRPPPQKPPHTFQRVRNTSLEFLQHSGAIAASDLRWAPDGGIVDGGRAAAGRSPCLYTGVTVFERTRQLILDVRGLWTDAFTHACILFLIAGIY